MGIPTNICIYLWWEYIHWPKKHWFCLFYLCFTVNLIRSNRNTNIWEITSKECDLTWPPWCCVSLHLTKTEMCAFICCYIYTHRLFPHHLFVKRLNNVSPAKHLVNTYPACVQSSRESFSTTSLTQPECKVQITLTGPISQWGLQLSCLPDVPEGLMFLYPCFFFQCNWKVLSLLPVFLFVFLFAFQQHGFHFTLSKSNEITYNRK